MTTTLACLGLAMLFVLVVELGRLAKRIDRMEADNLKDRHEKHATWVRHRIQEIQTDIQRTAMNRLGRSQAELEMHSNLDERTKIFVDGHQVLIREALEDTMNRVAELEKAREQPAARRWWAGWRWKNG